MEIEQRIPDLSDKELESLHANAARLVTAGTQIQKQQAEKLLPLLSTALEERRAARSLAQAAARKTNAKRKTAVKTAAKEHSE